MCSAVRRTIGLLLTSNDDSDNVSQVAHGNEKVSDEQILTLFQATNDPYLTASEVAEQFSMTRQGAHARLLDLHDDGELNRKKTGRTVGWWITENGNR